MHRFSDQQGDEDDDEDRRRTAWKHEQATIAAQVRVDPDPVDPPPGHQRVGHRSLLVPTRSLIPGECHLFGGVDVSFVSSTTENDKADSDGAARCGDASRNGSNTPLSSSEEDPTAVAVYVVWDARTGSVVYRDHEFFRLSVPYVPSFLAFREIEPLVRLIQKQKVAHPTLTPCAILVDGNGILHPRRAGIACFLGVRTGLATIGVGKSLYHEGGLTKEAVTNALDGAVRAAAVALQPDTEGTLAAAVSDGTSFVIFDSHPVRGRDTSTWEHDECDPEAMDEPTSREGRAGRADALSILAAHCQGLAVPLCCFDRSNAITTTARSFLDPNPLPSQPVLACVVAGHGGRVRRRTAGTGVESKREIGSAKPIFVSVGHRVSLSTAVAICASLSSSRIPEPIRQADLIGRELIRQHQSNGSASVNHAH